MTAQSFQQRLSHAKTLDQQVARSIGAPAGDAVTNVRLSLFAEAGQFSDLALLAGLFEHLDRRYPQFIMEHLDLLWTQARYFQHPEQSGWEGRFEFLVITEAA